MALILLGWDGVEGQRGAFNLILEDRPKRREGCSGRGNSVRKGLEVWLGPVAWVAEKIRLGVQGNLVGHV